MTTSLAHIVNPVRAASTHELSRAQPITFASMRLAARLAGARQPVELLAALPAHNQDWGPKGFRCLPLPERSLQDVGQFGDRKPLPLLADILQTAYQHSQAQWLVFTNVDIVLQPLFYRAVRQLLAQGHDALMINRRRVSGRYTHPRELPLLLSEPGQPHPGFDCFVFPRAWVPELELGTVCVGVQFSGVTLAHNLFAHSKHLHLEDERYLTAHVGKDVMTQRHPEFYRHNRQAFRQAVKLLNPRFDIRNFPYQKRSFPVRLWKRARNPSLFTGLCLRLELRELRRRWRAFRYRFF